MRNLEATSSYSNKAFTDLFEKIDNIIPYLKSLKENEIKEIKNEETKFIKSRSSLENIKNELEASTTSKKKAELIKSIELLQKQFKNQEIESEQLIKDLNNVIDFETIDIWNRYLEIEKQHFQKMAFFFNEIDFTFYNLKIVSKMQKDLKEFKSLNSSKTINFPVFGTHLETLCERENLTVPHFVQNSIDWLVERALSTNNIFTLSIEISKLENQKLLIDSSLDFPSKNEDINVVSFLLKMYFLQLPDPIITETVYYQCLRVTSMFLFHSTKNF